MDSKQKRPSSKRAGPIASLTSQSISCQTAAFLKSGGKIQHIDSGVSGQNFITGNKQIRLRK